MGRKRRGTVPAAAALYWPQGNVPTQSRPLRPLTEAQALFVHQYVQFGGDIKAAVQSVPIQRKDPIAAAREWLWLPEVLCAIREEQKRAALVAGSVALRTLIDVATDPLQSGTARVSAAKELSRIAMLAPPETTDAEHGPGANPQESAPPPADGARLLTRLRRVIFEETQTVSPVDHTPTYTADQVIDGLPTES